MIRVVHPGSRGQKGTESQIRICNTTWSGEKGVGVGGGEGGLNAVPGWKWS
jgi:hypothetical protein